MSKMHGFLMLMALAAGAPMALWCGRGIARRSLRCRAWACVLVLLFGIVYLALFGIVDLSVLFGIVCLESLALFGIVDLLTALVVPLVWARCVPPAEGSG